MAKIIIYMLQEPGHLFPSFKIMEQLQKKGHKIIYLGKEEFKKEITYYGFDFEEATETYLPQEDIISKWTKIIPKTVLLLIRDRKKNYLYNTVVHNTEIIKRHKPDLVILDDLYTPYVISLHECNIPIVLLSTSLSQKKEQNVPPFSSDYIPRANFTSAIWTELLWFKLLLRLRLKTYFGFYKQNKKIAKDSHFPLHKRINHNQSLVFGIKHTPTLILCPQVFDFSKEKKKYRFYVECNIIHNRNPIHFNWEEINLSKPIVYCCLGTQVQQHFYGYIDFFKKIIEIFKNKPNYNLIISTWESIDINQFNDLPSHIKVYNKVPQIEILNKSSLFITHGGLGSIKEAIFFGVPMLVLPVNTGCDQNGNAARVYYHKIGLRGNIREDSLDEINIKINEMLTTKKFQQHIKKMQDVFIASEQKPESIDIIESYIKAPII
jgi:zeaxanthin glucosyltransferase